MSDMETLASNIETNERLGEPKYKVLDYANRVERQLRSVADVLVSTLQPDFDPSDRS